ncbi:hypothetical protein JCM14076_12610 [Methylosoma difficile]
MANFYNLVFYNDTNGSKQIQKEKVNFSGLLSVWIDGLPRRLYNAPFIENRPHENLKLEALWFGNDKFESNGNYEIDEFYEGLTLILIDDQLAPLEFDEINTYAGALLLEGGFTPKKLNKPKNVKIFLSHKGIDKPVVRDFFNILRDFGFNPWLDEDAMPAGVPLERALLKGMQESCAAVFFITTSYKDEDFLATEINYAIEQKREKNDKFSIIPLVFKDSSGNKGVVPELLKQYVWKEPGSYIEGLREILGSLPIEVKHIGWKQN